MNKNRPRKLLAASTLLAAATLTTPAHAVILVSSNAVTNDYFGYSVVTNGYTTLVTAPGKDSAAGLAYYYDNRAGSNGVDTEHFKIAASNISTANSYFGHSASFDGYHAIISATGNSTVYYYEDIDLYRKLAGSTLNESARLFASGSGGLTDIFGGSVDLSHDNALVGAAGRNFDTGATYYYQNLSGKSGNVAQSATLVASNAAAGDYFGFSMSLSNYSALVSAYRKNSSTGAAYYYKNLDGASANNVTQNVILVAPGGFANDQFGYAVSLSGNNALVGAPGNTSAAYYYENLDAAAQGSTIGYNVKLTASDGVSNSSFGSAVSLNGVGALVSAFTKSDTGAVYYYKSLSGVKSGTVSENIKFTASDGTTNGCFGTSVDFRGNLFVIGEWEASHAGTRSGKAYRGDIRAFTTLDVGGVALRTDGLSFETQDNWVIGKLSGDNMVTLGKAWSSNSTTGGNSKWFKDTAKVLGGHAVIIGEDTGAAYNVLRVEGNLEASEIQIGTVGNYDNALHVAIGAIVKVETVTLASLNRIRFELGEDLSGGAPDTINGIVGSATATMDLQGYLVVAAGDGFSPVVGNEYKLFDFATLGLQGSFVFEDETNQGLSWDTSRLATEGIVQITAVPEPATYAFLGGVGAVALALASRWRRRRM